MPVPCTKKGRVDPLCTSYALELFFHRTLAGPSEQRWVVRTTCALQSWPAFFTTYPAVMHADAAARTMRSYGSTTTKRSATSLPWLFVPPGGVATEVSATVDRKSR